MKKLFTSESVTEGHPDKMCDQISDAVLDAILANDPNAHVACETCTTTGVVMVMGEITTTSYVPVDEIVRKVVCDIGYDRAKYGFDGTTCSVLTALHEQSPDIAQGVNNALEGREENAPYSSSSLSTAMNASVGSCTEPRERIFFLPSFCFSSSLFLRVISPP